MQRILDTGNKLALVRPDHKVPHNWFDMGYDKQLTAKAGLLIPVSVQEVLPSDDWKLPMQSLIRLAPLVAPAYVDMCARFEAFYCPYRILWNGFEDAILPLKEGSVPPAWPVLNGVRPQKGGRFDYMGLPLLPTDSDNTLDGISALPFAAYDKIVGDWYLDEDLDPTELIHTEPWIPDGTQPLPYAFDVLYRTHWDKDYFTSAKPWPQKGPAVLIPFDVSGGGSGGTVMAENTGDGGMWYTKDFSSYAGAAGNNTIFPPGGAEHGDATLSDGKGIYYDPNGTMYVASSLTALINTSTINDLRVASAMQRWLEADSFGTRFIEGIYNHFKVRSSDGRLQRAQYLGSLKQDIHISEVLQTSETASTPQGNMAGHGITHKFTDGIRDLKNAEEWGCIIVMMRIMPTTGYSQGVPRMFSRTTRFDFPWPAFANLGYQEVMNKEIYFAATDPVGDENYNSEVFGYQPRYTDWKMNYNTVAAGMRYGGTEDYWTLNRQFATKVDLTDGFISIAPAETLRIFASTDPADDHFIVSLRFHFKAFRPLPKFEVPKLF